MEDHSTTIHVDLSGDLDLLIEYEDAKTKATIIKTFVVSTKVLCLASPVWKTMFDPKGPWNIQPGEEGFSMPEDDPNALLILLDAAHLNFDRIPSVVSFDLLLQVLILCDKYDVMRLLRPWIPGWIRASKKFTPVCSPGNQDWLFIAWSFGNETIYNDVSKYLVFSVSVDEEGRCLDPKAQVLEDNMPPGAIGNFRKIKIWIETS